MSVGSSFEPIFALRVLFKVTGPRSFESRMRPTSRSSVLTFPEMPMRLLGSTTLSRRTLASAFPICEVIAASIFRLFIIPVPFALRRNSVPFAMSPMSREPSLIHCVMKWPSPSLVILKFSSFAVRYVSSMSGMPVRRPEAFPRKPPDVELIAMLVNEKSLMTPDMWPETTAFRWLPFSVGAKYEIVWKSSVLSAMFPSILT